MGKYIIRRLLWIALTLLWVSFLTFVLVLNGPGDPAMILAGPKAMGASVELLREQYGLDQPVYVQYLRYMGQLLRGDLGNSWYFKQPVAELLRAKFPTTALLALSIIAVAVFSGICLGIITAVRSNTPVDRALRIGGLAVISMPTFLLGLLLIYVFAFQLGWFPIGGTGTLGHLVLPTLSVALPWAAYYGIVLRSNMLDSKGADYVRTAYAKGLAAATVTRRHMLPNAILPVVTMASMDLAGLLTGIALVEYIFNWPGIGWQALRAAQTKDLPVIMGSVLLGGLLIGLGNLVADVLNSWLDPRVRLE